MMAGSSTFSVEWILLIEIPRKEGNIRKKKILVRAIAKGFENLHWKDI